MILLYNQKVQYHFRYSRIELDHIFPYYQQHRNQLYKEILSELFVKKTEANFESNGLVNLIIQFIGKRNNHYCCQITDPVCKTCVEEGCNETPLYGYICWKNPTRCFEHKESNISNMIIVADITCVKEGCNGKPLFNYKDKRGPVCCVEHAKKGMVDVIHKTGARDYDRKSDKMFAAVMSDDEFFQFTRDKFLRDIFSVLLKEIGEVQLWNYLLGDFSGPIIIERGDWGVKEERNFMKETSPKCLERGNLGHKT